MAEDEELAELQRRRLLELQRRAAEEQRKAELELQKQALLRRILTPEARQRLSNLRMVRPDLVQQLEMQLIQVAQTGRVPLPITDEQLKQILAHLQSTRREIRIRRV